MEKRGISDIYDEEFYTNLKIAKKLLLRVHDGGDAQIIKKWIGRCCELKSTDPMVKKNRNEFLKYFMQVVQQFVNSQKEEQPNEDGSPPNRCDCKKDYMAKWSPDKRTYVAIKPIPGEGALVYMAVTKDASLGWEHS